MEKELARVILDGIMGVLGRSLAALRLLLSIEGKIDIDRRCYVVFKPDGSHVILSVDQMNEMAADPDTSQDILLTLHLWMVKVGSEDLFHCAEMCDQTGVKQHWIAKISPEPDENQNWIKSEELTGSFKNYFDERAVTVGQGIASERAKRAAMLSDIKFDPRRWVGRIAASEHGDN